MRNPAVDAWRLAAFQTAPIGHVGVALADGDLDRRRTSAAPMRVGPHHSDARRQRALSVMLEITQALVSSHDMQEILFTVVRRIADIVLARKDLWVLSDEIYAELTYTGKIAPSISSILFQPPRRSFWARPAKIP